MGDRSPVIVGVADVPLERGNVLPGETVLSIQARAAKEALDSAGLKMKDVDGLLISGMWGIPGTGQLMSVSMGEYLGIVPTFADNSNIGGSVFELLVARASMAIEAGYCETALILYGSTQRSERSRTLGGRDPLFNLQYEGPYGVPTPVGGYAMSAMRHMHEYGTTSEQLASIAVSTRKWAQLNPAAYSREPLSVDEVLSSPMISDPLHQRDCCLVTDGGGAIVVTSAERAKDLKKPPIYVRGYGESHSHWNSSQMPDSAFLVPAHKAGQKAFAMAGVKHDDIDVVELYDSFTVTVLLTLEALGFCKPGEGGPFFESGRTAPGGDFPVNTNGGGLSCLHPGMYGMFLLIEASRQLWGERGEAQVAGAKTALCHGTGGTLSSGATCILSTERG